MRSSDAGRVVASWHALERLNQRAGAPMAPAEAVRLIEDAIADGRMSRRRPRWLRDDGRMVREACAVYAWPRGREFAYCLHEKPGGVLVLATVLDRATAAVRRYPPGRDRARDLSIKRRALEG